MRKRTLSKIVFNVMAFYCALAGAYWLAKLLFDGYTEHRLLMGVLWANGNAVARIFLLEQKLTIREEAEEKIRDFLSGRR